MLFRSLSELLSEAVQRINGEITAQENQIDEISDEQAESIPADPLVRNFSYTLVDGKVYFRENDVMTPAKVSMTAENRIKGLVEIRDSVRRLIVYQTNDYPDEVIRKEQEQLNRLYDTFTGSYAVFEYPALLVIGLIAAIFVICLSVPVIVYKATSDETVIERLHNFEN